MRRTLTSIIALGFAVTSTNAVLAQEAEIDDDIGMGTEDQQRFTDAGFEGARVLGDVEVARVTHDGETFYVVHGIDTGAGMGMDRTGIQPGVQPGQPGDQAAQPGQLGQPGDQAADPGRPGAETVQPGVDTAQPGDMQQDDLAADDPLAQDDLAADDPLAQDTEPGAQVGDTQPGVQPGTQIGDAPADTAADRPTGMAEHRSLEELLEEAGIEDYEILDDVRVASTRLGEGMEGQEVYVVYGLDDADGDS
jgi:hypothetical protein